MKVKAYIAAILTVFVLACTIPDIVFAYGSYDLLIHAANTSPDEDDSQPSDSGIVVVADEEIPLSNAALYGKAMSPVGGFISSAIRVTFGISFLVFGTLFARRIVWNKTTEKSTTVKRK